MKTAVERKPVLAAWYKEWAFVISCFSTERMAVYCVPDEYNKCHLLFYFSIVYYFTTLAVWVEPLN
jgi:hypothetical protein